MHKHWQCINCGAMSTSVGEDSQITPMQLMIEQPDGSYTPAGCSFCGQKAWRPILPQLAPEES